MILGKNHLFFRCNNDAVLMLKKNSPDLLEEDTKAFFDEMMDILDLL